MGSSVTANGAGALADDPAIHGVQGEQDADDDPPRFPGRGRVLFGDVVLAVRAARRVCGDLLATVGARDGRLTVIGIFVVAPILAVVVPVVFFGNAARHGRVSGERNRTPDRVQRNLWPRIQSR